MFSLPLLVKHIHYSSPPFLPFPPLPSFRPTVLRKMRALEVFDQLNVTVAERSAFSDTAGGVTLEMIAAGRWRDAAGVDGESLGGLFWCGCMQIVWEVCGI